MPRTFAPILLCAALACATASCSSGGERSEEASSPAPTATPALPNPDELAGKVSRFYRVLNAPTSSVELGRMLSAHFVSVYQNRAKWARDYGLLSKAKPVIDGVRDRVVSYTVTYGYETNTGGTIGWRRVGAWTFVHGSAGWLMDQDHIASARIVSLSAKGLPPVPIGDDAVFADGHHAFSLPGGTGYFTYTKDGGWTSSFVPAPTPSPVAQAPIRAAPSTSGILWNKPTGRYSSRAAATDCEQVGVEAVYQDGEVLKLDDGRFLKVQGYDTATSGVWVAPFDGLWCADDDKFTNTDDNESVDLAP